VIALAFQRCNTTSCNVAQAGLRRHATRRTVPSTPWLFINPNRGLDMSTHITLLTIALAAACASFTAAAQHRDAMKVCAADVKALCANTERGDGRIAKCLRDNQDKVSADCKVQMQKMGSRMKERRGQANGASAPSN
jgi:Cysteine rich repeat